MKIFLSLILIGFQLIMAQNLELSSRLYRDYEDYKEESLKQRRFKHADIIPLIEHLKDKNIFTVNKAGVSAEGRDIFLIKAGTGKIKVFLWSQMHGDEPTATMALFDIFNFLSANDDYNELKENILKSLTLYFMPMVNPDGAEVYQRRNIFEIDINRDAVRQQTPEGIILRKTFEELKADFGFNLHDQSTRYSAGNSFKPATISFLAPTTNYEKTVDKVREKSIRLIGVLSKVLNQFMPGHVAKYSDEFEPRAFGDNFQKWGTSTILVESGGWKNDPEKQFIRKMNFLAIISAFESIANKTYEKEPIETYDSIPFNEKFIMDLVLRNLKFKKEGHEFLIDIGINIEEENTADAKSFFTISKIEDFGDLSVFYGYEDLDLSGMEIIPGKIYPKGFSSLSEIKKLNFTELYNQGITGVILNDKTVKEKYTELPINIYLDKDNIDTELKLENNPNFIIKENDKVKYAVINGHLIELNGKTPKIKNGLIVK